jgi:hypothetical protein
MGIADAKVFIIGDFVLAEERSRAIKCRPCEYKTRYGREGKAN